mgnify:CR=1 FL=1
MAGIGGATWRSLVQQQKVRNMADWLQLTPELLSSLPGISLKKAQKMFVQLQLSRQKTFRQWLSAIGFPAFAVKEAATYRSWSRVKDITPSQWQRSTGIGERRVADILDFIRHPQVEALTQWLREENVPAFVEVNTSGADAESVSN